MTPIKKEQTKQSKVNPTAVGIVAAIVALLLFASAGLFWLAKNPFASIFDSADTAEGATTSTLPPEEEEWTGPVLEDYTGKSLQEVKESFSGTIQISAEGIYSETIPKSYRSAPVP